jgi:hypothetical protein
LTKYVGALKKLQPMNSAFFINHQQEKMKNCASDLDCASSELEEISELVKPVSETVVLALGSLETLLGNIGRLGSVLEVGEYVLVTTVNCLKVLKFIPFFCGSHLHDGL